MKESLVQVLIREKIEILDKFDELLKLALLIDGSMIELR
jgi:hypothetical protein